MDVITRYVHILHIAIYIFCIFIVIFCIFDGIFCIYAVRRRTAPRRTALSPAGDGDGRGHAPCLLRFRGGFIVEL
jgi:hypothetical protein